MVCNLHPPSISTVAHPSRPRASSLSVDCGLRPRFKGSHVTPSPAPFGPHESSRCVHAIYSSALRHRCRTWRTSWDCNGLTRTSNQPLTSFLQPRESRKSIAAYSNSLPLVRCPPGDPWQAATPAVDEPSVASERIAGLLTIHRLFCHTVLSGFPRTYRG